MVNADTAIIAGQERKIHLLRQEVELLEHHRDTLDEHYADLFNPPDCDYTGAYDGLTEIATFLAALPCSCAPELAEDLDSCDRCRLLGRRDDQRLSR